MKNGGIFIQFEPLICLGNASKLTKRNVLNVCSFFNDPQGFMLPITARIKTIFQFTTQTMKFSLKDFFSKCN